MEFKLSDFCLKVVSVPDAGIYFFPLKIWEKCSCHVILCRGRRTVGQGIINVLYITRERERERKSETKLFCLHLSCRDQLVRVYGHA